MMEKKKKKTDVLHGYRNARNFIANIIFPVGVTLQFALYTLYGTTQEEKNRKWQFGRLLDSGSV